jgi:hypothetical protein
VALSLLVLRSSFLDVAIFEAAAWISCTRTDRNQRYCLLSFALHKLNQESETWTNKLSRSCPADEACSLRRKEAKRSRAEIVVLARHQNRWLQQKEQGNKGTKLIATDFGVKMWWRRLQPLVLPSFLFCLPYQHFNKYSPNTTDTD